MSRLLCLFGVHTFYIGKEKVVRKFGRKWFKHKCVICGREILSNIPLK